MSDNVHIDIHQCGYVLFAVPDRYDPSGSVRALIKHLREDPNEVHTPLIDHKIFT